MVVVKMWTGDEKRQGDMLAFYDRCKRIPSCLWYIYDVVWNGDRDLCGETARSMVYGRAVVAVLRMAMGD